jgi:MFS family permease
MRRQLTLLWWGQFISIWGDACFHGAVPLVVKHMGVAEPGFALGLVFASATLPFLLFAVPFGGLVDRADRLRVMIGADFVRAGILLALIGALVWRPELLSLPLLCVVAFGLSTASALFLPARDALIPELCSDPLHLFKANALVQTSQQLGPVVGWVVAAGIVTAVGRTHLFTIDGASYLVSALLLMGLMRARRSGAPAEPAPPAPGPPEALESTGFAGEEGSETEAIRHPAVRALLAMTFLNNLFIMGPALVAAAYLINEEWALSDRHYVVFEIAFAFGMLAGTGLALLLRRRLRMITILLAALVWDGITYAVFPLLPGFSAAVALIFFHAMAVPLITVSRTSLLQQVVPSAAHGRVFARIGFSVTGATALSLALSRFLVDDLGAMPLFLLAGLGGMGTAYLAIRMPSLRALP